MSVSLTEKAAKEVNRVKDEQKFEDDVFLRVGAMAGGCSGYQYRLEFDKAFDAEKDDEYNCHGIRLVVDKKSSFLLEGTTIDWYEGLDARGFKFENPNVVKSCGCGSSFLV